MAWFAAGRCASVVLPPCPAAAVRVSGTDPLTVAVPPRVPPLLSVMPAGRLPDATVHVTAEVSPSFVASSTWEYGKPWLAAVRLAGENVKPATVIVIVVVTVRPAWSVTRRV